MFAGTLLIVLWAQICAQFVGMMGLKRLLVSGGATMGAPVPVPGQVIAPEPPVMGAPPVPPPMPTMGEPAPLPPPSTPPKHRTLGKPSPRTMGRVGDGARRQSRRRA